MENLTIGTKVKLTEDAKTNTYPDMVWKNDNLIIIHTHNDGEGIGKIYSFDSLSSYNEINCSLYGYELELI